MKGALVSFKKLTNSRGYPLVGEVIDYNEEKQEVTVNAYGLDGPGMETKIKGVPVWDVDRLPNFPPGY